MRVRIPLFLSLVGLTLFSGQVDPTARLAASTLEKSHMESAATITVRSAAWDAASFLAAAEPPPRKLLPGECRSWKRPDPRRFKQRVEKLLTDSSPVPPNPIVFVGSSSVRLWDSLYRDMAGLGVLRRGFGGSTVNDAVYYAKQLVAQYKPRAVVLYSGDNDIASGLPAECVAEDVERFVEALRANGSHAPVYILSVKPSPSRFRRWNTIQQANDYLEDYADREERVDYVDVSAAMLDSRGRPRGELFKPDGVHLNDRGYQLWGELVRPALTSEL
jgi:lysophospholipase L1-like esterase